MTPSAIPMSVTPKKAMKHVNIFDAVDDGQMSPYPTVVTVTMQKYSASTTVHSSSRPA